MNLINISARMADKNSRAPQRRAHRFDSEGEISVGFRWPLALTDPRLYRLMGTVIATNKIPVTRAALKSGREIDCISNDSEIADFVITDSANHNLVSSNANADVQKADIATGR